MAIDLSTLVDKKKAYIKEQAEKIAQAMLDRNAVTYKLETCNLPFYGWDTELHDNMYSVCSELRTMGINSASKVNFGVTDWVFTIN